jgi:hypothetical protein
MLTRNPVIAIACTDRYRSAGVAALALALESALGLRVTINMYHTPRAEQVTLHHHHPTHLNLQLS